MRCPACGCPNPDDAAFCGDCGSSLMERPCPECGRPSPKDLAFCRGCGAALAEPVSPVAPAPTEFGGGRYSVRRFLGEGGRKRAWLAYDVQLEREVAISVVKTEGLDSEGIARVRREAQAMGRVGDHPHIVTIYDIGDEDGRPYIVSQYVGGGSVADLLAASDENRLAIVDALRITGDVCQGLEHAHGHGVVHRDLKPGNIWLTEDRTAKLGDFGLAIASDRSRLSLEGMMVGTVSYMSPEQASGGEVDARSDLYSLGAVLYEMLCGRAPYVGDDAVAIITQHINTPPVAPSWHNPQVPKTLEALVLRLLAKSPAERPASAAAVWQSIQHIRATTQDSGERIAVEAANPLDRLAAGVFVGRETEVDELRAGLEEALSGRGRLMLLVGEPGIGKTSTAEELATYASLRHARVLWGTCHEEEGAPAFWPWVQIIRSYVHSAEPNELMSEMGAGATDIAQVVSDVRERLPDLPPPPALEPDQARFRLFDSITTFLRTVSRSTPLVLVLDDLHWADKPSLLLLQFLARELRGSRILVVGTYRDVALSRQHPLAQMLAELGRDRPGSRIVLRGLRESDVSRFIELTSGISSPAGLVEAVFRETEGNPFFVNEIVRLLVTEGRLEHGVADERWSLEIPEGVREVVGRRLNRLSPECNSVLTVASAIGREFSLDVLERVADLPEDQVIEVLDEAVAARVVSEVAGALPRYSFAHALIRETLYEELSTPRRVRLHGRIGEALEVLFASHLEAHLPELARHFLEAAQGEDVDKAVDYAVRAGGRAAELLAYEEAAGHYERALEVLELESPVTDGARRNDLLLALGDARWREGDTRRSQETFLRAAEVARAAGDAQRLAQAALGYAGGLGRLGFVLREDAVLIGLLEESLAALGETESVVRVRVLARLAVELYYTEQADRRQHLSALAVSSAKRLGDKFAQLVALDSRHNSILGPSGLEERRRIASEILRLAKDLRHDEMSFRGHHFRLVAALETGDTRTVDAEVDVCAALAAKLRQPLYLWHTAVFRATRALIAGRFPEAARLAEEALRIGQRGLTGTSAGVFGAQCIVQFWGEGRLAEHEQAVRDFARQNPSPTWDSSLCFTLAEIGRDDDVRQILDRYPPSELRSIAQDGFWAVVMSLFALACHHVGDRERAEVIYELLLPYADRSAVAGAGIASMGSVSAYLGVLASIMERWTQALAHFEYALQDDARMGCWPFRVLACFHYGEMLVARDAPGDRGKALALLNETIETGRRLGMSKMVECALAVKLRAQGATDIDATTSIIAVSQLGEMRRSDVVRHSAPDGTVTLLFSDIEGFDGSRSADVLHVYEAVLHDHVASHGGYEIAAERDGAMIAFSSARRAILCAMGVQRALEAHGREHPEQLMRVRMGLHACELGGDGDDSYDRQVNLASRIADNARGGQILVSSILRDLTVSAGDFVFAEPLELELEGLPVPQQVYPVAWNETAPERSQGVR